MSVILSVFGIVMARPLLVLMSVPRERYLDVIGRGLKEKYQLDDVMVAEYLNKAK